jgi:hypothetical protein
MLYPHARRMIMKVVGQVKLFIVGVGSKTRKHGPQDLYVTTCGSSSFSVGLSSMLDGVTHSQINVRTVKSGGFCIPGWISWSENGKAMENIAMTLKIRKHVPRVTRWHVGLILESSPGWLDRPMVQYTFDQ